MSRSSRVRAGGALALALGLFLAASGLAGCGNADEGAVSVPAKERSGMMDRMGGGVGPKSAKFKKAGAPVIEQDLKRRGGEG